MRVSSHLAEVCFAKSSSSIQIDFKLQGRAQGIAAPVSGTTDRHTFSLGHPRQVSRAHKRGTACLLFSRRNSEDERNVKKVQVQGYFSHCSVISEMKLPHIASTLALLAPLARALKVSPGNLGSLQISTTQIAHGVLDYYPGSEVGTFQEPYYWWESGVAWGALVDYWFYMEQDFYVDTVKAALLAQVGENNDYVPASQRMVEGNDDQVFWGVAVMTAAERNFPNPDADQPQWLELAKATFDSMASRWDTTSCGGGLRWQIYSWNNGYDYKNSVSNGGLFHLGARLARYTGNTSYVDWCEKIYDWMVDAQFVDVHSTFISVYDGAGTSDNCSSVTKLQWSYNAGLMMSGCAYLSDFTGDSKWTDRVTLFLKDASAAFFNSDGIMWEAACQTDYKCNNDQRSFKGILSRFMGLTAQLIPSTQDQINSLLTSSAIAAANSCSGGDDGFTCSMDWITDGYDGVYGLGEQLCAMEVIQNLQWSERPKPTTQSP